MAVDGSQLMLIEHDDGTTRVLSAWDAACSVTSERGSIFSNFSAHADGETPSGASIEIGGVASEKRSRVRRVFRYLQAGTRPSAFAVGVLRDVKKKSSRSARAGLGVRERRRAARRGGRDR